MLFSGVFNSKTPTYDLSPIQARCIATVDAGGESAMNSSNCDIKQYSFCFFIRQNSTLFMSVDLIDIICFIGSFISDTSGIKIISSFFSLFI